jgi:transcriptional regulator of heat shock response
MDDEYTTEKWLDELSNCLEILLKESLNGNYNQATRTHLSHRFTELKNQIDNIVDSSYEAQTAALNDCLVKMNRVTNALDANLASIKNLAKFLEALDQVVIQLSKFFGAIAMVA